MDYQKLNLLFRCNKEFSHRKIRMQDLTDTECMICSFIYSRENCSQDDVASALKTDKTTVGKALASLEQKHCVCRAQDGTDRRIKRLSLTAAGRERISSLLDIHDHWLRSIMTCLSPEEQMQFESFCDRLLCAAETLSEQTAGTENSAERPAK